MPRSTSRFLPLAIVWVVCGAFAVNTRAGNLVQDGNFESATPGQFGVGATIDGGAWTVSKGIELVDTLPRFVLDGSQSLFLNPDGGAQDGIKQTIATTAGQQYTLSFIANADTVDNSFQVLFGSTVVPGSPTTIPVKSFSFGANFSLYSFVVTAQSASTVLEFDAGNVGLPEGSAELDDISLVAMPSASAAAPLPYGFPAGLIGLTACIVVAARSRKRGAV